ncbi:hypothetical protein C0992_008492, partial [Termitomyces sp. T32_za158]
MSSPSASTYLISPAVLAARAYVPKLDMFLASLTNVGPGADQKTVVGAMKVFEKWLWHKGQAVDVTWSWENELREWCMARYVENLGAPWLASFEANFAPVPLSIEEHLASLLAEDGPFSLWTELSPDSKVTTYVEPLAQLDLARQERTWAEAATQRAAIMSAERESELLVERRVALAEHLAKRIAEARAAGFLEAGVEGAASGGDAVEMGKAAEGSAVPAGEAAAAEPAEESEAPENDNDADDEDEAPSMPKKVPTIGGSGLPPMVIKQASKSTTPSKRRSQKVVPQYEKGSCNKCWADNDPEGCWYPTGAQPCYRCDALKRACTFSGRKSCERGKVDPHVQRNFEKAVLVRHAREFVIAQWALATTGGTTSLSASSLALPTAQESGIAVDVAVPEPATPKGKAKAVSSPHKRLASPSSDSQPAKQSQSSTASRKAAKTVPCWEETPPVAGPSRQIIPVDPVKPVLHPGGVVLSEPESPSEAEVPSEHEEEAESSDMAESLSEVPAVPLHAV